MYVILLGPPGSGKGTQAVALAKRLGLCHISSGDLFRETVASGSELGRRIDAIMASGALVPDELTVQMVSERMGRPDCARGAVLDGFPRTIPQAQALDDALRGDGKRIDRAILIEVPEAELIRRLSSRWIDRKTGMTYNTETLGYTFDELIGRLGPDADLYQRKDDTAEAAKVRIHVYYEETMPMINHYRQSGIMHTVDGNRPVAGVQRDLIDIIEGTG